MDFDQVIEKQIRNEVINMAYLFKFEWKSLANKTPNADLFWQGEYKLTTNDGNVWNPTMGLGEVAGISQAFDGEAPELKLKLSGVDSKFAAKAYGAIEEYYGRRFTLLYQFFDEAFQPISQPIYSVWGLMRNLVAHKEPVEGGYKHEITLTAETPFSGRARAPNGYLTDADQKARYAHLKPADRGLEDIAAIDGRRAPWPPP